MNGDSYPYYERDTCRNCGDRLDEAVAHGLCGECWRWSTPLWTNNGDGTFQCPFCALADVETRLELPEEKEPHLEAEHPTVDPRKPLTIIGAKKRLLYEGQSTLTDYTHA